MAEYLPFAGKNAIVEMSLGIHFQIPFDSKIGESIEAIKRDFAEDFPKFDSIQQFTLNVGGPFPSPSPFVNPSGFVLTRLKPDMSPARTLRVMGNTISIHFTEYDSWQKTKILAMAYFDKCLRLIEAVERNIVVAVFMRYVDRFIFDGDIQIANAKMLFREDSEFLPLVIFVSGNLWHSNSGWYESSFGEVKALNNLNIASTTLPLPASITVDHMSVFSLPKPCNSLPQLFDGLQNQCPLSDIFENQHFANTVILKKLLNETTLNTIGLK